MQTGSLEFRPGLWPSIAAGLMLPLLLGLGFWQLDRAEQKKGLEQTYLSRGEMPAVDLSAAVEERWRKQEMLWRQATMTGEYLAGDQYLLDNRVHNGRAGYLVYSPLKLEGQDVVALINRGWIPMGDSRSTVPSVPAPSGKVTVQGTIKEPFATGLVLDGAVMEELAEGVVRVQHLDLEAVSQRIDGRVLPYIVRLHESDGSGTFVRDWQEPGFGRERHLGYAFQWFAMSAAVAVLYLVLNTRRNRRT